MLMKTDHLGFIVPAGNKLKPLRWKVQFRDCREQRKTDLYQAVCDENWQDVLEAKNIDQAVNLLEFKIRMNMNKCMPVRTVTMSTCDPGWMTPLVKYMLRNKSRISVSGTDRNRDVSNRISEVIRENRLLLLDAKMGSRDWW